MRILITGAGGQLGHALSRALHGRDIVSTDRRTLDVTDAGAVSKFISDVRPELAIHSAALTDTTLCERDEAAAMRANAGGAENVARACAAIGARLVAISTNEVFDGAKAEPYREDDAANAVNAYGRSKLEGERLTVATCPDTLIVRTSWLYGGGGDFVAKVLQAAGAGRSMRFVTDEIATPTSAIDLADAIRELIEREAPAGIYHLANDGAASRYEWAQEIVLLAGLRTTVEPTTSGELRDAGYDGPPKPAYSVLANTRAAAIGITMRPWRDALRAYFEQHGSEEPAGARLGSGPAASRTPR